MIKGFMVSRRVESSVLYISGTAKIHEKLNGYIEFRFILGDGILDIFGLGILVLFCVCDENGGKFDGMAESGTP